MHYTKTSIIYTSKKIYSNIMKLHFEQRILNNLYNKEEIISSNLYTKIKNRNLKINFGEEYVL